MLDKKYQYDILEIDTVELNNRP